MNPTKEETSNPNPHQKEKNGFFKSLVRFMFYNLDFQLGTLIKIYRMKIKKELVLFDRYYHDYFVDMERYQYNLPKFLPRMFLFMIPKPDLLIILNASPEVIYERKKELTIEEIEDQQIKYKQIAKKEKKSVIVDANLPLDKVVDDITEIILKKQAERTKRLLKS
jgi:thymidylate kinase